MIDIKLTLIGINQKHFERDRIELKPISQKIFQESKFQFMIF